jgi:uncharacterized tellurite resistance protein B-like protein
MRGMEGELVEPGELHREAKHGKERLLSRFAFAQVRCGITNYEDTRTVEVTVNLVDVGDEWRLDFAPAPDGAPEDPALRWVVDGVPASPAARGRALTRVPGRKPFPVLAGAHYPASPSSPAPLLSASPRPGPGDDMTREYPQEQLLAFVQAMANVAASDGRITEDERQQLDDMVVGIGLSPRDEQVAALIEREFQKPSRLTDIVSKIEIRELRVSLLRMLAEVACADGEIANEERASVKEAASAFGLDVAVADELIDWTLASIKLEQRERDIMAKLL